jgi:hypothetical protein
MLRTKEHGSEVLLTVRADNAAGKCTVNDDTRRERILWHSHEGEAHGHTRGIYGTLFLDHANAIVFNESSKFGNIMASNAVGVPTHASQIVNGRRSVVCGHHVQGRASLGMSDFG